MTVRSDSFTPDRLLTGAMGVIAEAFTLLSGVGALVRGSVLGKVLLAISAAVAGQGNTGNGTVTGIALRAGAQIGSYVLTCIGGTMTAAKSDPVGTGNGVLTLDSTTPILAGAQVGVYKIVCLEPGSNVGTFAVYDPAGVFLGTHVVAAAAFATQIKFAIADGDTDFAAGDYFTVTISAGVPSNGLGTFSAVGPDGVALANAAVGTAYTGAIGFTINDGTTNFAVGDTFTIAVAAGSGKCKLLDKNAVDGSQHPVGILAAAADATSADVEVAAYTAGDGFNEDALVFVTGTTTADVRDELRALGIVTRAVVSR